MLIHPDKALLVTDILSALERDDLCDVYLTSLQGDEIPACRFLLAARSPVLKRMLYGSFREAKSSTICMMGYNTGILQALVDYCRCNNIDNLTQKLDENEAAVRQLVQLAKAADYLEMTHLQSLAETSVRQLMTQYPGLACAVFDEAEAEQTLANQARQIIECRPYVALDGRESKTRGGGITCVVRSDRLLEIMRNEWVAAGEYFMFSVLNRWFEETRNICHEDAINVAYQCAIYIQYDNIEPQYLLSKVQNAPFVSAERIFEAVAKQALRASQDRIWSLQTRGRDNVERVLVEGAAIADVNGVYYRIDGLVNGDLYSKRELNCGQQFVYTLSCNLKDDHYECRIFCSNLLTADAVRNLSRMFHSSVIDPLFQPVLQIVSIGEYSHGRTVIDVSDGCHTMKGIISGVILVNAVIKILEFSFVEYEGHTTIKLNRWSLVNGTCGYCFGNPQPLGEILQAELSSERHDTINGLMNFYSCTYPCEQRAKDTKIPRNGWVPMDCGENPAPTCTWIPAMLKKRMDSRSVSSLNSSKHPTDAMFEHDT